MNIKSLEILKTIKIGSSVRTDSGIKDITRVLRNETWLTEIKLRGGTRNILLDPEQYIYRITTVFKLGKGIENADRVPVERLEEGDWLCGGKENGIIGYYQIEQINTKALYTDYPRIYFQTDAISYYYDNILLIAKYV